MGKPAGAKAGRAAKVAGPKAAPKSPAPSKPTTKSPKKLTRPKRQAFVEAYVGPALGNATEAARRAGYAKPKQEGHRLLTFADVAEAVDERLGAALDCMGADEVLREITGVARADWRDFLSVRHDKTGEVIDARFQLKDKLKALELLGRHHKLFTDNLVIGGKLSFLDAVREAGSDAG